MRAYKKIFRRFGCEMQKTVLGIVKGKIFEKLSSTDKYFPKKCAWYSRGISSFERNFTIASIFLAISVFGYMEGL
jgi:hypothetical protein